MWGRDGGGQSSGSSDVDPLEIELGRYGKDEYGYQIPLHKMSALLHSGTTSNVRTAQWATRLRGGSPSRIAPSRRSASTTSSTNSDTGGGASHRRHQRRGDRSGSNGQYGGGDITHASTSSQIMTIRGCAATRTGQTLFAPTPEVGEQRRSGGAATGGEGLYVGADEAPTTSDSDDGEFDPVRIFTRRCFEQLPASAARTTSPQQHHQLTSTSSSPPHRALISWGGGGSPPHDHSGSPYVDQGQETWRELRDRLQGSQDKYANVYSSGKSLTSSVNGGGGGGRHRQHHPRPETPESDHHHHQHLPAADERKQEGKLVGRTEEELPPPTTISAADSRSGAEEEEEGTPTTATAAAVNAAAAAVHEGEPLFVGGARDIVGGGETNISRTTTTGGGGGVSTTHATTGERTKTQFRLKAVEGLEAAMRRYVDQVEAVQAEFPALFS